MNKNRDYKININNGTRILIVKGSATLLSSLAENKIFLPSACGGKAICGLCKVQIIDGEGTILPTEAPFLSNEDISKGMRLSCQIKVNRDLKINIPEKLLGIRQFRTRVERITEMTYDIKEYRVSLIEPAKIKFKAGQYVQIESKPYPDVKEIVSRAYSVSSSPSEVNAVELIVRLVPGGICTAYMHNYLKVGDEATFNGPYGDFYLRDGADEIIFIAGGSGLGSIKSLILDILEKGLDKKMTFFFGAVTKRDLYYVEYFKVLEEQHKNFRYIPALSKPLPEDNWEGETGLITEVVTRYNNSNDSNEADLERQQQRQRQVYLCGSPGMINACINVLKKIGYTDDRIFYDKF